MTLVSTEYLRNCQSMAKRAELHITEMSFPSDSMTTLLRSASLGGEFISFAMGKKAPIDLATLDILHPEEHPQMVRLFDMVDRIVQGSKILQDGPVFDLYAQDPSYSIPNDILLFRTAQNWFLQKTHRHLAAVFENTPPPAPTVDDFKRMAIEAFTFLELTAERDWNTLLHDDIRWCFACHPEHRVQIMNDWPQTKSLLDAFDIHAQLLSVQESLQMVWPLAQPNGLVAAEQMPLPSMDV